MNLIKAVTTLVILATGSAVSAAPKNPCEHDSVPPPKHFAPKHKRPPKHNGPSGPTCTPPPPSCTGPVGPVGPAGAPGLAGADGKDGKDGTVAVVVVARPGLSMRLGLMGAVYGKGDWAWGPALELAQPIGERGELVVDVGFGLPLDTWDESAGHEQAVMYHVGYARFAEEDPTVGYTLGIHGTSFQGSAQNGQLGANYLGVDAGMVVRQGRLRFEVGPILTGLREDRVRGTSLEAGAMASLFVRL